MIGHSPWWQISGVRPPKLWRRILAGLGRGMSFVALVYLSVSVLSACQSSRAQHYVSSSRLGQIDRQPTVRVRIKKNARKVRLDGPRRLTLRSVGQGMTPTHEWAFKTPVLVHRRPNQFIIEQGNGQAMAWNVSRIMVSHNDGKAVRVDDVSYPQQIALDASSAIDVANRFDVVNHVTLERYIPGVLAGELYRRWPSATFEAQAIAARSYAIVQCAENWHRHFDLESTTASQVYGGSAAYFKALKAAQKTHGVVLTYQDNTVPAYYSSCCGGSSQDAHVAFPYGLDIRPLWGDKHRTWCTISPHYRWGPIIRSRDQLSRRLTAWGRARKHPIAALDGLSSITTADLRPSQRPGSFIVTDMTGQTFSIRPESFRAACNYQDDVLAELAKPLRLKSSYLEVYVQGDQVRLTGHGFGHGVGMCQWGAYAMAKRGYDAQTILSYYYPSAAVQRIY